MLCEVSELGKPFSQQALGRPLVTVPSSLAQQYDQWPLPNSDTFLTQEEPNPITSLEGEDSGFKGQTLMRQLIFYKQNVSADTLPWLAALIPSTSPFAIIPPQRKQDSHHTSV